MKTLNHLKLSVANKAWCIICSWRGQFTPELGERDLREPEILR
jgi:hypothetical protein